MRTQGRVWPDKESAKQALVMIYLEDLYIRRIRSFPYPHGSWNGGTFSFFISSLACCGVRGLNWHFDEDQGCYVDVLSAIVKGREIHPNFFNIAHLRFRLADREIGTARQIFKSYYKDLNREVIEIARFATEQAFWTFQRGIDWEQVVREVGRSISATHLQFP